MSDKSVFLYEVLCHEKTSAVTSNGASNDAFYLTSGMGFASNFGEAAKLLEDVYDEDLEAIKNIEFCYLDDYVITLPREVLHKYKNEEYEDRIPCDADSHELVWKNDSCGHVYCDGNKEGSER